MVEIKYIEKHVVFDDDAFYVWYDNHYIYDFIKLSDKKVYHILTKTVKKLKCCYKLTCEYYDIHLYGYSKLSLKRKFRRLVRKHNKSIRI